jgi:hypothetical protein
MSAPAEAWLPTAATVLRHRHRRAASPGKLGGFGTRGRTVLGDVGVRFGGSEHHRIGTSSSHTRPPPFGVGTPGHGAGQAARFGAASSRFRGAGPTARFGAASSQFHRGQASGALRRTGRPASSEQGSRSSSGRRQASSRDRDTDALRSGGSPVSSGQSPPTSIGAGPRLTGFGTRRLSGHRPPYLAGTGQPGRFGAPASQFHRDRATGALRSTGQPVSSGQGTSGPSGSSAPHPT